MGVQERDNYAQELDGLVSNLEGLMQEKEQLESQMGEKAKTAEGLKEDVESLDAYRILRG